MNGFVVTVFFRPMVIATNENVAKLHVIAEGPNIGR
jgi:hypothetical protein